MILKRVKIGTRLLIGFGGVLATLATLAAIGLVSVTSIGGAVDHVVTIGDEATTAGMMRAAVNSQASLLKDLAMAASPAEVTAIERKLDDEAGKYQKAETKLTALFDASGASATQRGLYAEARTRAETGRSATAELIALAHAGDSAGLKTRLPVAVAALLDWRSKLNDLVKIQSGLNEEAAAMARHSVTASQIMVAVTAVVGLILGLLLSAAISGSITTPLRDALQVAENVAAGRLEAHVSVPDADDETAQLLRALARMNDTLRSTVGAVASGASALAESARTLHAQASHSGDGAEQQAREMEASAAAVEEMSQSIRTIADAASELREASSGALVSAERSGETMEKLSGELGCVTKAVQEIHSSVGQFVAHTAEITGMTREVRELADQTNLLALNAAIEAARAGEMGRGFAVVADEVRKLAEHSAKAASRIDGVTRALEQQSGSVQAAVQRGLQALDSSDHCTTALSTLLQDSRSAMVNSHQGVEGIAMATREQLLASSAIASGTEHASMAADRQRKASAEVKLSAGQLQKLAADLQAGIGHFRA